MKMILLALQVFTINGQEVGIFKQGETIPFSTRIIPDAAIRCDPVSSPSIGERINPTTVAWDGTQPNIECKAPMPEYFNSIPKGGPYIARVRSYGYLPETPTEQVIGPWGNDSNVFYRADTLTISCPQDFSQEDPIVTYPMPIVNGGVAPTTISCSPPNNTTFFSKENQVACLANDFLQQTVACAFTVTVIDPIIIEPPPPGDTLAPSVIITNIRRSGNSPNFQITTSIKDDIGINKVEFLVNGILQVQLVSPPFNVTLRIQASGSHIITVRAFDEAGNVGQATATVSR